MKNSWKKYAAIAMAGVLSAGMLSGCGDKKEEEPALDGTKTVATVNGEAIPMGLLSFSVRNQQAYIKAMYEAYGLGAYVANLWDGPISEDSDVTYGDQTREDVLKQLELMYLMKNKAGDYNVEITAEEQEKIAAAAAAFMEANSEETIATLGVSEEDIKTYLELETYSAKLRSPIREGADHEVSDEQAQMSTFSFVHVTVAVPEEEETEEITEEAAESAEEVEAEAEETTDAEVVEDTEEAAETEETAEEAEETEEATAETDEPAEPTAAELEAQAKAKENAEAVHEALEKDPEADLSELVKSIDESLVASTGKFQTNLSEEWEDDTPSYLNEDMIAALRELKEGEITAVIETEDDGYFVARLDKEFDEDATETERQNIISERENTYYDETTSAWLDEAEITVDEEVLKTLKVVDSMVFTTVSTAAADEAVAEVEEVTEEDAAEEEATEEETTDETAEEVTEAEETDTPTESEETDTPAEEETAETEEADKN